MFYRVISTFILFAILPSTLQASSLCDDNLNEKSPTVLQELSKLSLAVLQEKDRVSRLLLRKVFEEKLKAVALELKISEATLRQKLSEHFAGSKQIKTSTIEKPKTEKTIHQQIQDSFLKEYEDYSELMEKAEKYFNALIKNATRNENNEVSIDLTPKGTKTSTIVRLETLKAYVLIILLQNEFAANAGITLAKPVTFDFTQLTSAKTHGEDPAVVEAILREDKTLVEAMVLLGAEIPKTIKPEGGDFELPLLVAYLVYTLNPKVEFIQFLVDELNVEINEDEYYNPVQLISEDSKDADEIKYLSRDEDNTLAVLEFLYSQKLNLFFKPEIQEKIIFSVLDKEENKILQWLVDHQIKINFKWSYLAEETTPLHYAITEENKAAVEILLQAGADVNMQDENGKTALALALESHVPGMDKLFDQYRKK